MSFSLRELLSLSTACCVINSALEKRFGQKLASYGVLRSDSDPKNFNVFLTLHNPLAVPKDLSFMDKTAIGSSFIFDFTKKDFLLNSTPENSVLIENFNSNAAAGLKTTRIIFDVDRRRYCIRFKLYADEVLLVAEAFPRIKKEVVAHFGENNIKTGGVAEEAERNTFFVFVLLTEAVRIFKRDFLTSPSMVAEITDDSEMYAFNKRKNHTQDSNGDLRPTYKMWGVPLCGFAE